MLASLIDSYIAEAREEFQHTEKFRVSDAGRCRLMRYWKRQGKEPTDLPDERTLRVFEVGHVFHKWLQDCLKEKGVLIEAELEVEDLHRKGHVDAIVFSDDKLVLYDFKTVHSRKFNYLSTEKDIHYHFQALTYAMMLPFGVDSVRIAYISKDDLRIQEIEVLPHIEDEVRQDWLILIEAWERKQEPEPNPKDWECKYCIYRSSCEHNNREVKS